jgi:hypothetical protein
VFVFWRKLLENNRSWQHFLGMIFPRRRLCTINVDKRLFWLHFGQFFPQTHLVTLFVTREEQLDWSETVRPSWKWTLIQISYYRKQCWDIV